MPKTYQEADETVTKYLALLTTTSGNEADAYSGLEQATKESLAKAYNAIKVLVGKLKDHEEGISCTTYDAELINILEEHRKQVAFSFPLYRAVFLKLIQDAVKETGDNEESPWSQRDELLMYGWRCRLLSVLVYSVHDKFLELHNGTNVEHNRDLVELLRFLGS